MASMFISTLQGKKVDFDQLGYSMAERMIQKMLEGILNQIIPTLANGVVNIFNQMGGGGGGFNFSAPSSSNWFTNLFSFSAYDQYGNMA